jgi:hypothetical protein
VHAARQSQNAHDVTRDERGVEDGVKRLAAALERETRGYRNLRALRNNRGACGRVELVIANDLAERHRHVEISRAPDLEHDWSFAIAEVLQKTNNRLNVSHSTTPSAAIHSEQFGPQLPSRPCAR